MRFSIVCIDTRGGIQPYLALGVGLFHAGHDVCMIAPENYASVAGEYGLTFRGLPGDVQSLMEGPEYARVAEKGFLATQSFMIRKATELIRQWMQNCLTACEGSDVIVAGIGGLPVAESVAEKLGVRFVQAHVQPLTPTAVLPAPLAPGWLSHFGGAGCRFSHVLTRQIMWQPLRPAVNAARRSVLGLPPAPFWGRIGTPAERGASVLYGYSRHVLPKPPDWGARLHVTGYWFLEEQVAWQPPEELAEFLRAGPAPVVVGFGSMKSRDAAATAALVVAAIQATGQRAVLLSGWGGLRPANLPSSIITLEAAPHSWLFPRSSLVVHHGGAGTTGAVFRAGVPGVVVPFGADQPYWGRLVASLECGPRPIPRSALTAARLAGAIQEGLSEGTRRQSAAIGALVRQEDGVRHAVELLASEG